MHRLIKGTNSEYSVNFTAEDIITIAKEMVSFEQGEVVEQNGIIKNVTFRIGFVFTVDPNVLAVVLQDTLPAVNTGNVMCWEMDTYTTSYIEHNNTRTIVTSDSINYKKFTSRYVWCIRPLSAYDRTDGVKIIYDKYNNLELVNGELKPIAKIININKSFYFGAENPLVHVLSNCTKPIYIARFVGPGARVNNIVIDGFNTCTTCRAQLYDLYYYNEKCQHCQHCRMVDKRCKREHIVARCPVTIHDRIRELNEPLKDICNAVLNGYVNCGTYIRAGRYLFIHGAADAIYDLDFNFSNMIIVNAVVFTND